MGNAIEDKMDILEKCNKEQLLSMFGIMTIEHLVRIKPETFKNSSKEQILEVLGMMEETRLRELLLDIDYGTLQDYYKASIARIPKRKEIETRDSHTYSVFYDDNDKEIMNIGFPGSDCWWFFKSANPVVITKDMELYDLLMHLMRQKYDIPSWQYFVPKKTEDELLWYSDCYCNPADERSVESVSRLIIRIVEDVIILQCFNDCFDKEGLTNHERGVGFGSCGNGSRIARNKRTHMDLGYDFITLVNNPLQKPKTTKLAEEQKKKEKSPRKQEKK